MPADAPEIQIFDMNRPRPRHRPRLGGAYENRDFVAESGEFPAKIIEIPSLSAAIGVPAITKEGNLHHPRRIREAYEGVDDWELSLGFDPEEDEPSGVGGAVLIVRIVHPIQNPRPRIPKNPAATGMARAQ